MSGLRSPLVALGFALALTAAADAAPAVSAAAGPPKPPSTSPTKAPDGRRIVGILEVRVDGVAPEVAATFQANLEQQLDTGHFWLATRARVKQMMERSTKWTDGCVVGACLREVRTQTGAELVVIASLTGSGTSYGYVVTLLRTDTGEVVSQDANRCEMCTEGEAVSAATLATINLVTSAPDKLPDAAAQRASALDAVRAPYQLQLATLQHHKSHSGAALVIAGVVAAAAGTIVFYAHDHDRWGLAGAGAGLGLVGGGVVVLKF